MCRSESPSPGVEVAAGFWRRRRSLLPEAVREVLLERHEYMIGVKWPSGRIVCPKCGGENIGRINSRRMLQCKAKECRKQFSSKVDTLFEDSPLGLDKWFVAVWCVANAKNGISSHELSRALGVRQPSAWFMLHRIRLAMKTGTFQKLDGTVESDETYVGGKSINMHASRRAKVILGRDALMGKLPHVPRAEGDKKGAAWKKARAERKKKP